MAGNAKRTEPAVGDADAITFRFKKISFTVDSALLRELGERLVGRAPIALGELVKNSYDADARRCEIRLSKTWIEVTDDGKGMSAEEFLAFWMRIGTRHKERSPVSELLKRPVTGSKGIGRLAVQFLGSRLELWTRSSEGGDALEAKVDWSDAVEAGELVHAGVQVRRLHDAPTFAGKSIHGTTIRIHDLKQDWDAAAVTALAREIWMLQPPLEETPFADFVDPQDFRVAFESYDPELEKHFKDQLRAVLDTWDAKIDGEIKSGRQSQRCTVRVRFDDGEVFKETIPIPECAIDEAKFRILTFNLSGRIGRGMRVQDARAYFEQFGGVHVIDAGFRLPYYGIEQDWLGIEVDHARRMATSTMLPEELQIPLGMRELPSTRRLFGRVAVNTGLEGRRAPTKKGGERATHLQIQLTRDRLLDNDAYRHLRLAVRAAVDFYAMCVRRRRIRTLEQQVQEFSNVGQAVTGLRAVLAKYEAQIPAVVYQTLVQHADTLEKAERLRGDVALKEKVLLASLATAGIAAVAIEHEVSKQLVDLEELLSSLHGVANERKDDALAAQIKDFRSWIDRVRETRQLFSPLMNEADRDIKRRFRARKVVEMVVGHARFVLREAQVDWTGVPESILLPEATMAAWYAVFQNVLINAVNAMLDLPEKRINISGGTDRGEAWLLMQDVGVGVELNEAEELFKPFVRRLQISEERRRLGLGGTGLGLTIVKMIAESAGCTVSFVPPSPEYSTAFKISWHQ